MTNVLILFGGILLPVQIMILIPLSMNSSTEEVCLSYQGRDWSALLTAIYAALSTELGPE